MRQNFYLRDLNITIIITNAQYAQTYVNLYK